MTADQKTAALVNRLQHVGIGASFEQAQTLRRAELVLYRADVHACNGTTSGRDYATPALRRAHVVCAELGIFYYHQDDPCGCSLYVWTEPMNDMNYLDGVSCCVD